MEAEVQKMSDEPKASLHEKLATAGFTEGDAMSKSNRIKEGLEKNISEKSKNKIYNILNEVNRLSDIEKLLLYLKLPTGVTSSPVTTSETSFHRDEHQKAMRWLKTHLEEDTGACVQKQELYDQYREYCDNHKYKCVNQFDFGKLLRHLFPNLKLRHLGQRGQSKTCYGGLKSCSQLKPLAIPKLDISEDLSLNINQRYEEDQNITEAACELVCEWAQKLFGNQHFTGIQELSEHLISNCVVSTNSTAAFTIIAAAQKEDRKIFPDGQDAEPSKQMGSDGPSTSKSVLQPKTQLQLQRTLKGRKNLREQREKMEGHLGDQKGTRPQDGGCLGSEDKSEIHKFPDSKPSQVVKKTNNSFTSQKHILPKCSVVTQVISTPSTNSGLVAGGKPSMSSTTPATPMTPGSAVPQPVFVLPSQVMSSTKQSKIAQSSQVIKTPQMLILSPVNNNNIKSNGTAVSFMKENLQCGKKAAIYRSQNTPAQGQSLGPGANQPSAGQSGPTKANSKLAMLLTEDKTDNNERRLLEKALKHKDSLRLLSSQGFSLKQEKTETQLPLRHLKTTELQRLINDNSSHSNPGSPNPIGQKAPFPVTSNVQQSNMISSGQQSPAILQNSSVLPAANRVNRLLIPVKESLVESSQTSTPTTPTSMLATSSCTVNCTSAINSKNRKKATPVKPRHSSKTVSTLLKETRGYGPQTECKGFVNDRRPVAQLLKESRIRKLSTESPNTPPGMKTTSGTPTQTTTTGPMMVQSVTVAGHGQVLPVGFPYSDSSSSPDVISSMMMTEGGTTMEVPRSSQSSEATRSRLGSLAGAVSGQEANSTVATASGSHSGVTQLPLLDPQSLVSECTAELRGQTTLLSGKDPFTCFGKEPIIPGSELMMSMGNDGSRSPNTLLNQDGNNNQGCQAKLEPTDSSNDSYELKINLDGMDERLDNGCYVNNVTLAQEPVNVNINHVMEMKDEVSISNLEKDALTDYLRTELATDLADITPSLTERVEFVSNNGMPPMMNEMSAVPAAHVLIKRALVAENRNPFMSPSVLQQQQNNLPVVTKAERMTTQSSVQRPASELVQYNQEMCQLARGSAVERPSTMPPELDATRLFQNLLESQLSVSVQDQSSGDSMVTYNPGQATPSSQMMATRSPSYCSMGSAPSTPSSLMSPPERFPHNMGSSEPTNSFMPIHGGSTPSTGSLPLDQVSPIRPMVTLARKLANGLMANQSQSTCNKNSNMGARDTQMGSFPRLSNPAANCNINYESSFVPYSMSDSPSTYTQQMTTSQHQCQQSQTQPVNDFLPASSIRPVKRPMAGTQTGGRKRVRHRSAQDAQSLAKAQAKKAIKFNMLTNLLKAGVNPAQPLQGMRLNNPIINNRPCNLPKPLIINNNGQNLSNPQSPFSPEMQDIMTGDGQTMVESQESMDLNAGIFRSQSVPAQSLQRAGSEPQDLVTAGAPLDQPAEEYLKEGMQSEILHLLQDKLQEQNTAQRGTHTVAYNEFSARRNINNLLQEDGNRGKWGYTDASNNSQYRVGVRGDHMISGASVRTSQALINNHAIQLALAQRLQRAASYPGDGVPTPPSSQNPTPDFSSELSTLGDPAAVYCMGRGAVSTVMDTPNSLDPLTTGDSQESLKEDMLADIYKENPDMAMQSTLTPNQEVWQVREGCPQWPQS